MHKPNLGNTDCIDNTSKVEHDINKCSFIEIGVKTHGEIIHKEYNPQSDHFHLLRLIYQNRLVEGIFWEGETIGSIIKVCFKITNLNKKSIFSQKNMILLTDDDAQDAQDIEDNEIRLKKSYYILYQTENFEYSMIKNLKYSNNLPYSKVIKDMSVQMTSTFSKPHGLENLGNTCFMNSGLQCLLALTPFTNKLVCSVFGSMATTLTDLLIYKKKPNDFWKEFTDKVKRFGDYMQHDVQEFVGCLLDCIDCENDELINSENKRVINNGNNNSENTKIKRQTIIDSCFKGELSSRSTCLSCNHVFTVYEPFLTLSLSIPPPDSFHPSVFYSGKTYKKLNVSMNLKVKQLKNLILQEYGSKIETFTLIDTDHVKIESEPINSDLPQKKFMIVCIKANTRIILEDEMEIKYYPSIFCYEYDPNEIYSWVVLKKKGIITDDFLGHILLKSGDNVDDAIESWTNQNSEPRTFVKNDLDITNCLENYTQDESLSEVGIAEEELTTSDFTKCQSEHITIEEGNDQIKEASKNEKSNSDSSINYNANIQNSEVPELNNNIYSLQKEKNDSAKIFDLNPDITFFKSICNEQIVLTKKSNFISNIVTLNVIDCIKHFIKEELLTDTNKPSCINCETKNDHKKGFRISKLPECLIIHLKRFAYSGNTKKVMTKISLNKILRFGDKYFKLVSYANHSARSAQSGHYTAYTNRAGDWWLCNDSNINKVKEVYDDNAYLLFYELINYN